MPRTTTTTRALPAPKAAPFDTVVVLMMENRSFDHMLGWMPGANGKQAGLSFADAHGAMHATHGLAPDFSGCAFFDPKHDWESVAKQYNGGACDGFLRTQPLGDTFPIGYYTDADLSVTAALARGHTVCDRYYCSVLGPTGPNRMYAWSATTDYLSFDGILNGQGRRPSNVQLAIFDRLHDAGVSGALFAGGEPQSYAAAVLVEGEHEHDGRERPSHQGSLIPRRTRIVSSSASASSGSTKCTISMPKARAAATLSALSSMKTASSGLICMRSHVSS